MKITKEQIAEMEEQIAEMDRKAGLPNERFTYNMHTVICEECGQEYEKEFTEPTWPHLIGRCPDCGAPIIQHSATQEVENTCNCDSINKVRKLSDLTNEMIQVRKNFENIASTETVNVSGGWPERNRVNEEGKRVVKITKTYFSDYVLEESSDEANVIEINHGCLVEGPKWRIKFNIDATGYLDDRLDGQDICCHAIDTGKVNDDGEKIRVLPRAVVALNEGGYAATVVCLDCILEVAKCPIVKERKLQKLVGETDDRDDVWEIGTDEKTPVEYEGTYLSWRDALKAAEEVACEIAELEGVDEELVKIYGPDGLLESEADSEEILAANTYSVFIRQKR